ncbi:MAG: helix-turn-helix transcriptional regulator [Myxococcales bacterium]|nr:helix-turn-helix transcriptional regulator [Myxococcales bacterium]
MNENEQKDQQTTLGQRLRARLQEIGNTQTWLADKAGINRSRVNRIFNDRVSPSADELDWLLGALSVADRQGFIDGAAVTPSDLEFKELEAMRQARIRAEARSEALQGELEALRAHYEAAMEARDVELEDQRSGWVAHRDLLQKELAETRAELDEMRAQDVRHQEQLTSERQGYEQAIAKREDELASLATTRNKENLQHQLAIIKLHSQLRERDAMIKRLTDENSGLKALAAGAAGVGVLSLIGYLASQD